jgi:hypothetical protein
MPRFHHPPRRIDPRDGISPATFPRLPLKALSLRPNCNDRFAGLGTTVHQLICATESILPANLTSPLATKTMKNFRKIGEDLSEKYDALVVDCNRLRKAGKNLSDAYDEVQQCVAYASTLEEAQACMP